MPASPLTDSTAYNVQLTSVFGCGTIWADNIGVYINVADTFMGNLNFKSCFGYYLLFYHSRFN